MNVLLICGSLRADSLSAALLNACVLRKPATVTVAWSGSLGALPLFNPDLDISTDLPHAVQMLRNSVAPADALLVASPEYAHGVTGTVKNALDWLVSCADVAGKRVAVLNPAPDAHHADASLHEILRTMALVPVPGACLRIAVIGAGLDAGGIATSDTHAPGIDAMWRALVAPCAAAGVG